MKQYTATVNDDGVRLSRFVQSVTRDFPTSLLYKSFRNKRVKVNGKKAAPEYRLQTGDLIELYINDEFFPPEGAKPAVPKAAPKKKQNQPKVTVIYEDENIAVLYKPTHLCATATAPAMQTLWMPSPNIWPKRASMTLTARTASSLASATGWTAAPRALSLRPRATPPCGT